MEAEDVDGAGKIHLEEIDQLGGNGRWRQRKADEFFRLKTIEDQERLERQRQQEERRRRHRQEGEARRRRQQQEEEEKQRAEEDRLRKEREYREESRRHEEEKQREVREQEHREWLARQPHTCDACGGTALCSHCEGKGVVHALFLCNQVAKGGPSMDFGRIPQGCEHCGGCRQNIQGEMQDGSGRCANCSGRGKVWPPAAFEHKAARLKFRAFTGGSMDGGSPKSMSIMSSPKAFSGMGGGF